MAAGLGARGREQNIKVIHAAKDLREELVERSGGNNSWQVAGGVAIQRGVGLVAGKNMQLPDMMVRKARRVEQTGRC